VQEARIKNIKMYFSKAGESEQFKIVPSAGTLI
jgi:hypothetical protein